MPNTPFIISFCLLFAYGLVSPAYSETQIATNPSQLTMLKKNGVYVRTRFLQRMKKPFTETQNMKALIIGDSHAQDFFNGVLENNFMRNYQIRTRYIPTRCQIYLSDNLLRYTKNEDKELCKKSDNLFQAQKQISEADLIILVASWREWSAKALPSTIRNMKLNPKQKLLVIGRKSFSKPIEGYKNLSNKALLNLRRLVDNHQLNINKIMKDSLDKDIFINLHQLICGDLSSSCPAFTDELKPISYDGGHFTKSGAQYITKILFKKSSLGDL